MPGLPIKPYPKLQEKPGSFGAMVDATGLYLPVSVYAFTREWDWRVAEIFFYATLDFPEAFQDAFGWTPEQCQQATEELRQQLRGFIPDHILDAVGPVKRNPFGALLPDPKDNPN